MDNNKNSTERCKHKNKYTNYNNNRKIVLTERVVGSFFGNESFKGIGLSGVT